MVVSQDLANDPTLLSVTPLKYSDQINLKEKEANEINAETRDQKSVSKNFLKMTSEKGNSDMTFTGLNTGENVKINITNDNIRADNAIVQKVAGM